MSDYLNFAEGQNRAWLTGVKFVRGTNEKPRNKIALFFSEKPSSETHTSPGCKHEIAMPLSSDQTSTKIMFERRIKSVLYPLAGLEVTAKTTLKDLYYGIESNLSGHDIDCTVEIKLKEGNTADRDGNPRMFAEVLSVVANGYQEKAAYESDINFDEDVPF